MRHFLYVIIALAFFGCKKTSTTPSHEFKLEIGGQRIYADSVLVQYDSTSSGFSGMTERSMRIFYFIGNDRFNLLIHNWNWQNPPTDGIIDKTYYNCHGSACSTCKDTLGSSFCDGWDFTYLTTPQSYMNAYNNNAAVDVTDCNEAAQEFSCSFSGIMYTSGISDSLAFSGSLKAWPYAVVY